MQTGCRPLSAFIGWVLLRNTYIRNIQHSHKVYITRPHFSKNLLLISVSIKVRDVTLVLFSQIWTTLCVYISCGILYMQCMLIASKISICKFGTSSWTIQTRMMRSMTCIYIGHLIIIHSNDILHLLLDMNEQASIYAYII